MDQTPRASSQHACKQLELNQQKARCRLRSAPALLLRHASNTPAGPYLTTSFKKAVVK